MGGNANPPGDPPGRAIAYLQAGLPENPSKHRGAVPDRPRRPGPGPGPRASPGSEPLEAAEDLFEQCGVGAAGVAGRRMDHCHAVVDQVGDEDASHPKGQVEAAGDLGDRVQLLAQPRDRLMLETEPRPRGGGAWDGADQVLEGQAASACLGTTVGQRVRPHERAWVGPAGADHGGASGSPLRLALSFAHTGAWG